MSQVVRLKMLTQQINKSYTVYSYKLFNIAIFLYL